MLQNVRNLLYRKPELYELAYPSDDAALGQRWLHCLEGLNCLPRTVLDIGCGTGRILAGVASQFDHVVGIDISETMVDLARRNYPGLEFATGDMRTTRLGSTFDAILMLGNVLTYVQSNQDLDEAIQTILAHSHRGSFVTMSLFNPFKMLALHAADLPQIFTFSANDVTYEGTATYRLDRATQRVIRERQWVIDGELGERDYCSYRMFFPQEIEFIFSKAGFDVISVSDDIGGRYFTFSGEQVYVTMKKP